MPVFKEMDEDIVLRLIQGYEDELTPETIKQDAFYRQFSCPRCSVPLQKEHDPRTAFDSESIVPKALLRCPECRYLLEPHSGVIIERGSPQAMPMELPVKLER